METVNSFEQGWEAPGLERLFGNTFASFSFCTIKQDGVKKWQNI